MKDELIFPLKVLEEYAERVAEYWPNPLVGTYLEKAAWLCLDYVSAFSYVLEQIKFFKTLEDALYYIQNPGKFSREYGLFYEQCKAFQHKRAVLKIAEAITNDE